MYLAFVLPAHIRNVVLQILPDVVRFMVMPIGVSPSQLDLDRTEGGIELQERSDLSPSVCPSASVVS